MPDAGQQAGARARRKRRHPAGEIGPGAEYNQDGSVSGGGWMKASVYLPCPGAASEQSRRRGANGARAAVPEASGFGPAFLVCIESTGQDRVGKLGLLRSEAIGYLHGP